jgi:hypothetical protein
MHDPSWPDEDHVPAPGSSVGRDSDCPPYETFIVARVERPAGDCDQWKQILELDERRGRIR